MLELESVHVPKTAGITFLEVLRHWYGPAQVGVHMLSGATPVGFDTTVMHGHLPAGTFNARRRIVWLRDPARRLISHYFYLRYQKEPGSPAALGAAFHREVWQGRLTLEEFVEHPHMARSMSCWLNGLSLDDFAFVGIQEDFDRELLRCAIALDKPAITIDGGENRTVVPQYAAFRRTMDPALLDRIRALHPECTALYEDARSRAQAWWREHEQLLVAAARATAAGDRSAA